MAGTVTYEYAASIVDGRPVRKLTIAWISHTDGTATGTSPTVSGTILGVTFDPGSPAPTASYDVTLSDQAGRDVLAGQGANLSDTVTTGICPGQPFKDGTTTSVAPITVHDTLDVAVSNAGSEKQGSIVIYLR